MFIQRVKFQNGIAQKMNINMCIKFGCSDGFVTQKLLNGSQVCSIFQ